MISFFCLDKHESLENDQRLIEYMRIHTMDRQIVVFNLSSVAIYASINPVLLIIPNP